MPNPYLPRDQVHDWSEKIGADPVAQQTALGRLLRQQRRLTKFLQENSESMKMATAQVSVYLFGVVARMFDLAGGQLRAATWEQIRDASARIGAVVGDVLPADEGFAERVRKIEWRAQPHVLDEAILALFEREPDKEKNEEELGHDEAVKVFFLLWAATEVLDANWTPPKGYAGETIYSYVPIRPTEGEGETRS